MKYLMVLLFTLSFVFSGNVYSQSVKIGNQIWMQRNLDVDHYRNGDPIPQVTAPEEWINLTTGAWCYYDNDSANGRIYGKLYNWYAVNDPRGLAPEGWHVPSDEEWKQLESYLGMDEEELDHWGDRGTNEGSKIAGDYDLWVSGSFRNNNEFGSSGFTGMPGGYRNYSTGYFSLIGNSGVWWSSTEYSSEDAIDRYLNYSYGSVFRYYISKRTGRSVRCVRD